MNDKQKSYKLIKAIDRIKYDSKVEQMYFNDIKNAKPIINLKLFKKSDDEVEILKNSSYQEYRNNPRIMYEMANLRMGEVAYLDTSNLMEEELYSFMSPAEQKAYENLPFVFIAYRGYASKKIDIDSIYKAQSWSVKKEVAEFFVNEHCFCKIGYEKVLVENIIFRNDVALVLLDRDEAEIVLKSDR